MTVCADLSDSLDSLLKQYQAKQDPTTFRRLHDLFDHQVRKVLDRFIPQQELDDCMQEFWMAVATDSYRYDPDRSATNWLLGVAVRSANAWLTKQNRRKRGGGAKTHLHPEVVDATSRSQVEQLITREEEEKKPSPEVLQHAIAKLSADERLLIEQRFFKKRPWLSIAQEMGRPEITLRKRMQRILKKLKRELTGAI